MPHGVLLYNFEFIHVQIYKMYINQNTFERTGPPQKKEKKKNMCMLLYLVAKQGFKELIRIKVIKEKSIQIDKGQDS